MDYTVNYHDTTAVSPKSELFSSTPEPAGRLSQGDTLYADITKYVSIFYGLFLFVFGTLFNVISLVILGNKDFQGKSSSIYLRYLAIVDLITLCTGPGFVFIKGVTGYSPNSLHVTICRFDKWMTATTPDISAWTLIGVNLERVISIACPHKVKDVCSNRIAISTVTLISLLAPIVNIALLFFTEIKIDRNKSTAFLYYDKRSCDVDKSFTDNIWLWVDLVKFLVIPWTPICVFNTLIFLFVVRQRRKVQRLSSNNDIQGKGNHSKGRGEVSLAITLLVINFTYLVCNAPFSFYQIGQFYWFSSDSQALNEMRYCIALCAAYTNNAINPMLYCLTSANFRKDIKRIFKSCARK